MKLKELKKELKRKEKWRKEHKVQTFFINLKNFVFYGIWNRINDAFYEVIWGFQRMFRGYDDTAFWSLSDYITRIALPVLKDYKKYKAGIPFIEGFEDKPWEEQSKEWQKILDKIIKAFTLIQKDDFDFTVHSNEWYKKNNEEIQEGLELFGKYFRGLWD